MKAVCLLSGGIDSSTLAYYLKAQGCEVHTLTIKYGQKHSKEIVAAGEIASSLGISHKSVDLPLSLFRGSALTGVGEVPKGYYTASSMSQTVVPNRNMVLLSLAGAYAVSIGADSIAYAAHSGDHAIYPDCRPEFVGRFGETLYIATGLKLLTPFLLHSKAMIVKEGLALGVPYRKTWSCYEGKERACLECGTCVERTEAFQMNGMKDPLLTTDEWVRATKYLKEVKVGKGIGEGDYE